jgi:hypothetical protein
MLVPLTRKTLESLIPTVATGEQYGYCWGKLKDLLRRVLISVVGMFAVLILYLVLGSNFAEIFLITGIGIGLYWLWEPVLRASLKNREYRRYPYGGFWQGRVMDMFVSEELVRTEDTVNNRGDLVVVENRERCLNLEVADRSGFSAQFQVPLKRAHRAVDIGDSVEMLVFSNRGDLSRIVQNSDLYIPDHKLWISDYPYVQRDAFMDVRRRVEARYDEQLEPEAPRRQRSPRSEFEQTDRRPARFDPQDQFDSPDSLESRNESRPSSKRIPREERARRDRELERSRQQRFSRDDNPPSRSPRSPQPDRLNRDNYDRDYDPDYDSDYPPADAPPRRKRTPRFP